MYMKKVPQKGAVLLMFSAHRVQMGHTDIFNVLFEIFHPKSFRLQDTNTFHSTFNVVSSYVQGQRSFSHTD